MNSTASRYELTGKNPAFTAAALRTLGFKVSCKTESDQSSAGKSTLRWFSTDRPADVRDIVKGRFKKPEQERRVQLFRVMLDAMAIRRNLDIWLASGGDWYEIAGAAKPEGIEAKETHCTVIPFRMADLIAAAIAVGHSPRPRVQPDGASLLSTAPSGTTILELGNAVAARRKRERGYIAEAVKLAGAEPEEHAFQYAYEALKHLHACREAEEASSRNRVGLFRGDGGRTAIVSESILRESSSQEQVMRQHLAGMLV